MAIEEFGLQQGSQTQVGADANMGLVRVREGQNGNPPEAVVAVKDSEEGTFTLHPGDTFPIGEQTWRFDRVVQAGGNRLGAVFARIE
ncbi:DUF6406 domain-containing protein [Actinomadura madurae]|uniref:DUF6406 domain-containing protein n=1 Tax=Actinomadura madurae TaxID=1993 RepID=UPI00202717EC|nr:DUF6406 domain-containing protein [Actinomadura madurae]MCP9953899.1 hypothetical protein [Actinomadura madurae]MCP9970649.1 hypothetical protein [Actinomadura madurae]MCP9983118.1 hypothetical protein [Actinomadura madurae]MCQ0005321.1 hypothetical protein [Actinomadura madurae]MCQ0019365.1 hypothetical protein [Actinomadura madurae]